jgi:AcrR family transcriptional regulator
VPGTIRSIRSIREGARHGPIASFSVKKPVAARRAEILEATCQVVAERGFGPTRVLDVASRLGVSTGLIHYHFDSKDHLLAEAFTSAAQRDIDRFPATRDAPTATEALARAIALYTPAEGDSWAIWIDAWAEAQRNDTLRSISRDFDAAWVGLVEQIIKRGVAAGEFVCADTRGVAWRIAGLIDGLAVEVVVHDTLVTPHELVTWTAHLAGGELQIDAADLVRLVNAARAG